MNHIESWMSRDPETLEPERSALEAFDRMLVAGIRHVPIVTRQGDLVGIVSSDDLRAALPFDMSPDTPLDPRHRAIAARLRLDAVMTYFPTTVHPTTTLDVAVSMLMERHIGCLPVVDLQGKLVGIFTETDALRVLLDMLCGPSDRGTPRAGGQDLRAIAQVADELREERERIARRLGEHRQERRELEAQRSDEPYGSGHEDGALFIGGVLAAAIAEAASRRIEDIDRALERYQRGELDRCAACGRAIPLAQLRALPGADRCIRCAAP